MLSMKPRHLPEDTQSGWTTQDNAEAASQGVQDQSLDALVAVLGQALVRQSGQSGRDSQT